MSGSQPDGLGKIGQFALSVNDLPAAVVFYRDQLGLPLMMEFPGLAFFDCNGIRLMLSGQGEGQPGGAAIYFSVSDLAGQHATLMQRGVVFEGEPHCVAKLPDREIWMAFFKDPSGNLFALMSEIAPAA